MDFFDKSSKLLEEIGKRVYSSIENISYDKVKILITFIGHGIVKCDSFIYSKKIKKRIELDDKTLVIFSKVEMEFPNPKSAIFTLFSDGKFDFSVKY